jgi:hypothetical protein
VAPHGRGPRPHSRESRALSGDECSHFLVTSRFEACCVCCVLRCIVIRILGLDSLNCATLRTPVGFYHTRKCVCNIAVRRPAPVPAVPLERSYSPGPPPSPSSRGRLLRRRLRCVHWPRCHCLYRRHVSVFSRNTFTAGPTQALALSDSGLGVRVSMPTALPSPGMRNEAPLPT